MNTKIDKKAVGIGFKAGLIASLCCIIPLILIIFGLTSASVALKFVQYKPYFISLSVIFLVLSIFVFFRKKEEACCLPEEKFSKKWFIGAAVGIHLLTFLILLYVLIPNISPFVHNLSSTESTASLINNSQELKSQLHLKISGMTCSSCATGIKYELERLNGVIEAGVSFYQSRATITYDSNKITSKEILESEIFSDNSPYQAKIIEDKKVEIK